MVDVAFLAGVAVARLLAVVLRALRRVVRCWPLMVEPGVGMFWLDVRSAMNLVVWVRSSCC